MLRWLQKNRPSADRADGRRHQQDRRSVRQGESRTRSPKPRSTQYRLDPHRVHALLDFEAGAVMANNADWLDRLPYIPFLRDCRTLFTINKMLDLRFREAALEREQPLTFSSSTT
jgi:tyrosyl-tRNA synthetase